MVAKVEEREDEVLARAAKFEIGQAAFEMAKFMYPGDVIHMRQGARIILKSRE